MKKDIEWLKKELDLIEDEAEKLLDKYIDRGPTVDKFEERLHSVNIFRHLLNQLDEPEVLSQEWIDENKKDSGVHYIGYYVPIGRLHDLLVPKQGEITEEQAWEVLSELYDIPNESYIREAMRVVANYVGDDMTIGELKEKFAKPVIPQFVADWVESRDYYNVYKVLQDLSAPGSPHASKDVRNWIFRNQENVEKFVRAWLDGYEVEEEQKYVVPVGENHALCKFTNDAWGIYKEDIDKLYLDDDFKFTEQEIKDYDPRYLAFKVKVEELEE